MKEWFKYRFGYINIDSEFIYLTKNGVWSETNNLNEIRTKKYDSLVLISLVILVYFFIIIFLGNYFLVIFILLGLYAQLEYFTTGYDKFKIRINKISTIKVIGKNVEIAFLDGNNLSANYIIRGCDKKGIHLFSNFELP